MTSLTKIIVKRLQVGSLVKSRVSGSSLCVVHWWWCCCDVWLFQSSSTNITITLNLTGFEVTSQTSKHGFHVHEYGSLGDSCSDAGSHFNPHEMTHGAPWDDDR